MEAVNGGLASYRLLLIFPTEQCLLRGQKKKLGENLLSL